MSLHIYVAAPYPEGPYAKAVAAQLAALGHTITSDWFLRNQDTRALAEIDPEQLEFEADRDLVQVANSDVFLLLNLPGGFGGKEVETGYAIAVGALVIVVGERTNIFHHYTPSVKVVSTVDEAILLLPELAGGY